MTFFKAIFKVRIDEEAQRYLKEDLPVHPELQVMDFRVENPNLNGIAVKDFPGLKHGDIVISRVWHGGAIQVALPKVKIFQGDIIRVVGTKENLEEFRLITGSIAQLDLRGSGGKIISQSVIVTRSEILGKTISQLEAYEYGVTITRVRRAEMDLTAHPSLQINYADTLVVVGEEKSIQEFSLQVGNSRKNLAHPQLIPVFLGIAFGVMIGNIPFNLPGIPAPVRLGIAGGPLLTALVLSQIGRIGRVVWYMPTSANFMLREIGISLFLACVGIKSGGTFIQYAASSEGLLWIGSGALITLIPAFITALAAKFWLKLNYLSLCGLLAGSTTNLPALSYANNLTNSNAQVVSYAAVYPATMILRVITAQLLVIYFLY